MVDISEWRIAFAQAVVDFKDWDFGGPEPEVTIDRQSYLVGAIFDVLENISDQVPDEVYIQVSDLAQLFRTSDHGFGYECAGPKDHTYKKVAQCMRELHRARTAHYRRKESERRSREGS